MIKPFPPRGFASVASLALGIFSASPLAAQVWNNTGTDFAANASWSTNAAPANNLTGTLGTFSAAAGTQPSLAANRSVRGLAFTGSGYTFSGAGTLTLGASGITNSAATTLSLPLKLGASASFTGNTGTGAALTIAGPLDLGAFILTLAGTAATSKLTGAISGAGAITQSATGTWELAGGSTYAGQTTVSGGTLIVSANDALGASNNGALANRTNVTSGATLAFRGGFNYSSAELLRLSTSTTGSLMNLSGNNSFAGPIEISGLSRVIATAGQLTLSGQITGSPQISHSGAGVVVLANSTNSFLGAWSMGSGATLVVAAAGALGSTNGQTNVNNGTTLAFQGGINYVTNETVTVTGNGAAGRNGAIDNLSGDNRFAGTLRITSSARIGAAAGTTLTLAGAFTEGFPSGVIFAGPGTIVLAGTNGYTGMTTVAGGTLLIDSTLNAASLTTVQAGATLGGTGTLAGPATFQDGAHLAPGDRSGGASAAGTLTFAGGLALESGTILDFQLGTISDLIAVTGGVLTGPGGAGGITLNLSDAGGFTSGASYTLFSFVNNGTGGFEIADFTFGTVVPGTLAADYAFGLTSTALLLTYTNSASAIPEPSTYAGWAGAAALALAAWRRRTFALQPGYSS